MSFPRHLAVEFPTVPGSKLVAEARHGRHVTRAEFDGPWGKAGHSEVNVPIKAADDQKIGFEVG